MRIKFFHSTHIQWLMCARDIVLGAGEIAVNKIMADLGVSI